MATQSIAPRLSRQQRAIDKCEALRWWCHADRMTETVWMVDGTTRGTFYRVTHVGPDQWTCECQAGQVGQPCFHSASAWLSFVRDQSGTARHAGPVAHPSDSTTPPASNGRGIGFTCLPRDEDFDNVPARRVG